MPRLRADFKLIELYQYRAEAPLDCPITAFGGAQDTLALPADLAAWQTQSSGAFSLQLFPGGHFYLQDAQSQLLAAVQRELISGAAGGR